MDLATEPINCETNSEKLLSYFTVDHVATVDDEEVAALQSVANALRFYEVAMLVRLAAKRRFYDKSLTDAQRTLLGSSFVDFLTQIQRAVRQNQLLMQRMLGCVHSMFENVSRDLETGPIVVSDDDDSQHWRGSRCREMEQLLSSVPVPPAAIDRLQSVLRHLARDWSAEGSSERNASYGRVLSYLERLYPHVDARSDVRVLVPGAGLGRLAFEVASRKFQCQGNEFSYYMLIASHFILNECRQCNQCTVFPYINAGQSNLLKSEDAVRPIFFPDVNPSLEVEIGLKFSMTAGDFLDVYGSGVEEWDAILTVFFVDTSRNILDYIQLIYQLLKPGCWWINFGPLLYHFSDSSCGNSLELSWESVKEVIEKIGFEFVESESGCRCSYAHNSRSMLLYEYQSLFWVCRKPK